MNRHIKILIFLITIFLCEFHPFNISVTEIHHVKEEKALQITTRFFLDDLEDEYEFFFKERTNLLDTSKSNLIDSLNTYYSKFHFNVYVNDKESEIFYLGKEYDDDTMILYYEIYNVSDLKKITVYNNSLMASFEQQTNLIHLYNENKFIKTLKLTLDHTDEEYEYE